MIICTNHSQETDKYGCVHNLKVCEDMLLLADIISIKHHYRLAVEEASYRMKMRKLEVIFQN